jgi:hypothetical protein
LKFPNLNNRFQESCQNIAWSWFVILKKKTFLSNL